MTQPANNTQESILRSIALKTKKVSTAVLEEIRRMIVSGEIKEGDKFPNQNDFAAQLGVSRPSLREALQVLSQMGAIEQRPGAGTILVSSTPALFSAEVETPLVSNWDANAELMETRRMVEVGLAGMAAKRASDTEIAELGQALGEMDSARQKPDKEAFAEADLLFHHLVAKSSHNRFSVSLFQSISQSVGQLLNNAFQAMPVLLDVSFRAHRKIFRAIAARDPEGAREAMDQHLREGESALSGYYKKRETSQTG
jgi:GntR family transcriptional regulator, transcriptional repressor for pyruvate dehydrogenase complex